MPEPMILEDPALFLLQARRRDFGTFLKRAWPHISGGELITWNWHIDAIAHELHRVETGENLRFLVNMPPRSGKSKIVSVIWVAWMLGMDPTRKFVCVSYSNELSGALARDCLSIMQSDWYCEIFPRTRISKRRAAAYDFCTTRGGGRFATSVTGTLTGRGGDIIILDDVIKPDDALSDTVRNSVNLWYKTTLASRLDNKLSGAILCVMQRLHQYDLAGTMLEDGGWHQLKLPAIATEEEHVPLPRGRVHHWQVGDVLQPEREPMHVLKALEASIGSVIFAAQYQQDPVPPDGNVIKAGWFRHYDPITFDRRGGQMVQSWDTASKDNPHNDYSACVTAYVRDRDIFIVDVFRRRMQIPELKRKAIELAREHRADALLIEDQSSGQQLLQLLRDENNIGVPNPIRVRPEGDKLARMLGAAVPVEAGQLHFPHDAPWLPDFLTELLGFPSARYDDQADAFSQLVNWVRLRPAIPIPYGGEEVTVADLHPRYVEHEDEAYFNSDAPDDDPAEDAYLY